MIDSPRVLRLSPFVLPEFRLGVHTLMPQNLAPGPARVAYGRRVNDVLQQIVAVAGIEAARAYREQVPFGTYVSLLIDGPGGTTLEPMPDLELALGFDLDALSVLLRDGRSRVAGDMAYLETGAATPAFVDLLWRLHAGCDRAALLASPSAEALGLDDGFIDDLLARGVLEVAPPPRRATADGITWMGHAYVVAKAGGASIWVDPYPMPRLAWTDDERAALFVGNVPDTFLLADYGPGARQVTQDELEVPAAVFITHQDTDHFDLGGLALLPPHVPIFVPRADPSRPWDIDLVQVLRTVLGEERDVRAFGHGEVHQVGDVRVTAMPFVGEFPASLPHAWNTYLVELPDQVWALTADSSITEAHLELLRARRGTDARPLGLMTNGFSASTTAIGYTDTPDQPMSAVRLYSWYLPPIRAFEPAPAPGLPLPLLRRLAEEADLRYVYPYAHGNLPWYRLRSGYVMQSHIGSHTLPQWSMMERQVAAVGATVPRLRHGEAWSPSTVQLRPQPAFAPSR